MTKDYDFSGVYKECKTRTMILEEAARQRSTVTMESERPEAESPDTDERAIASAISRMNERERSFFSPQTSDQGSVRSPRSPRLNGFNHTNATIRNDDIPLTSRNSARSVGYLSARQYLLSATHLDRQGSGVSQTDRLAEVTSARTTLSSLSQSSFDYDQQEEVRLVQLKHHRPPKKKCRETDDTYMKACSLCGVVPSQTYLKQVSKARAVSMSNCSLAPRTVKPIAISLVRDRRVNTVDFSGNDLGPLGVMYIGEMLLENHTIFDLDLSGTNMGHAGLEVLADRLPHNKTLRILRLESNNIDHTETHYITDILHNAFCLSELYLGHNNLGYQGAKLLAAELEHNTVLRVLDLKWNHFRRESAKHLCNAIRSNQGLYRLNLGWNGIGKEGCIALARALPKNDMLKDLDLTNNRIDVVALPFLLHGLVRNSGLTTLSIGKNPMTTEGAKALVKAITGSKCSEITQINMETIPVDRDFTALVKALQTKRHVEVVHDEEKNAAIELEMKEHDPHDLNRFDPIMVLIEYIRIDNLRLIDLFQFFDTHNRGQLSRTDLRDGVATLGLPLTEYHLDLIMEGVDTKKDGYIDLEEFMMAQRDMQKTISQRTTRAKGKGKEDLGLKELRKILKELVEKRNVRNREKAAKKQNTWTGAINKVKAAKTLLSVVKDTPEIVITETQRDPQGDSGAVDVVDQEGDTGQLAVSDPSLTRQLAWQTPRDP